MGLLPSCELTRLAELLHSHPETLTANILWTFLENGWLFSSPLALTWDGEEDDICKTKLRKLRAGLALARCGLSLQRPCNKLYHCLFFIVHGGKIYSNAMDRKRQVLLKRAESKNFVGRWSTYFTFFLRKGLYTNCLPGPQTLPYTPRDGLNTF